MARYSPAMGFTSIGTTRLAAAISVVALIAITASDFFLTEFWNENTMATSVVADILVLIVGVAVINEFVAARARRAWILVADYALVELASSCRHVWVQLAEEIGVGSRQEMTKEELRAVIEDTDRLKRCASAAVSDPESRPRLHEMVAELVAGSRATLTNWAPLLVATPRANSLSRYIELQTLLSRIDLVLWEDAEGRRPSFAGSGDPDWLSERISALIRLGSELELEFFAIAAMVDRGEQIETRLPTPTAS
jgi:hypothetical protein